MECKLKVYKRYIAFQSYYSDDDTPKELLEGIIIKAFNIGEASKIAIDMYGQSAFVKVI